MSENKYSVLELIRYIFSFFLHRREKGNEKKRFKKIVSELNNEFQTIDDKKEDKKQEDIEKRLNNMF